MTYLVIDGLIGAGKTTLLRNIAEKYPNIAVGFEPINEWINYYGTNTLEEFYKNTQTNALGFQLVVLDTILNIQKELLSRNSEIYIQDRYPLSGLKIFTPLLNLPYYQYKAFENITNHLPIKKPDIRIYLKCNISTAQNRLKIRNRSEESGVTDEYQTKLLEQLEKWAYSDNNVITLNGDASTEEIVEELMSKLIKF